MIRREWLLALRDWSSFINPTVFFLLVCSLFPLAISQNPDQLKQMAPAILWLAALLAVVLALNKVFEEDFADGSIEQWLLAPDSLYPLILCRLLFRWLLIITPMLVSLPMLALMFHLTLPDSLVVASSIVVGTPTLMLLGSVMAALLLASRQGNVLLALLTLPLMIPVLIFGTAANFSMLAAMLFGSLSLAPFAIAGALRISVES